MQSQAALGNNGAKDSERGSIDTPQVGVFFFELEQVENIAFDAGGGDRPTGIVLAGTARA
jgi:hypothetical protein